MASSAWHCVYRTRCASPARHRHSDSPEQERLFTVLDPARAERDAAAAASDGGAARGGAAPVVVRCLVACSHELVDNRLRSGMPPAVPEYSRCSMWRNESVCLGQLAQAGETLDEARARAAAVAPRVVSFSFSFRALFPLGGRSARREPPRVEITPLASRDGIAPGVTFRDRPSRRPRRFLSCLRERTVEPHARALPRRGARDIGSSSLASLGAKRRARAASTSTRHCCSTTATHSTSFAHPRSGEWV